MNVLEGVSGGKKTKKVTVEPRQSVPEFVIPLRQELQAPDGLMVKDTVAEATDHVHAR
jgi:hypothetical protein